MIDESEERLEKLFEDFRATCGREGAQYDYKSFASVEGTDAEELQSGWMNTLSKGCLKWARDILVEGECKCHMLSAGHCLWLWQNKPVSAVQYAEEALKAAATGTSSVQDRKAFESAFRIVCHALLCSECQKHLVTVENPEDDMEDGEEHPQRIDKKKEVEGLASAIAQIGTTCSFFKVGSVLIVDELTYIWHSARLTK